MTQKEKDETLARLAAGEVASLKALDIASTAEEDKIAAFMRIIGKLDVPILQAKDVYARLLKKLQDSDLTINFTAYKFFNSAPKGTGYVNQFEGGNKWGGASYITTRDGAEEKLFDYSNTGNRVGVNDVVNRVKTFGSYVAGSNTSFEPCVRPKYAALNYASLRSGSAGQWGLSYVVLKEHIKHNSTFVHTDSFDIMNDAKAPDMVANYLNMQRLLVNMPETMLKALYKAASGEGFGSVTQVPGLSSTAYIEAHVHAGIQFDRDIAKICVANSEVAEAEAKTKALVANGKPFKVVTSKKLKEIFTAFGKKNGITIEYV